MTEKNADVEWLRALFIGQEYPWPVLHPDVAHRLLAHIDQLEAELNITIDNATEREMELAHKLDIAERRPTADEIAVQMMAAMRLASYLSHKQAPTDSETIASWSYADAEALVAEGRRRDGI